MPWLYGGGYFAGSFQRVAVRKAPASEASRGASSAVSRFYLPSSVFSPLAPCERSEQGKLASVASKLSSFVSSLDSRRLLLSLFYVIEHFLRGSCHSHGDTTVSPKRRILVTTCHLSLINILYFIMDLCFSSDIYHLRLR